MSAPVFVLPQDTGNRRVPKSSIDVLRISSDPALKSRIFIGQYTGYHVIPQQVSNMNPLQFMSLLPVTMTRDTEVTQPFDENRGSITYDIDFDGASELQDDYNYWIAATNYSANPKQICTFKCLHVDGAGDVLIKTPHRIAMDFITISPPVRCGRDYYLCCEGATSSALANAVLIEHLPLYDNIIPVYSIDALGPPTWRCRFFIGNTGVGMRNFTLQVANAGFDSNQLSGTY